MSDDSTPNTLLIVNLGTPENPTPSAVRRYLAEFLSDKRVVSLTRWLWLPLLHLIILPFRSPASAKKYAKIWLPEGSPLMVYTQRLAQAIQQQLPHWQVDYAMRYGQPALKDKLNALQQQGIKNIHILPLYPQYSTTTTATVADVVDAWKTTAPDITVQFIDDYSINPNWVTAVANSITKWREQHSTGQKLVFSFHGLPQRVADAGDPYPQRCQASAAAIACALQLNDDQWILTYQSRFGREAWLEPSTEPTLLTLTEQGLTQFDVVCPGFAVDCLETLEEVALYFAEHLQQKGAELRYIPCLNDSPAHAQALSHLVTHHDRT